MTDIKIISQHLSQYHAGQTIEASAHICRDMAGTWHAVVSWHDQSDQTTSTTHTEHSTQREADRAIAKEVIVSCESFTHVYLRRVRRIKSALEKVGVSVSVDFNPVTLDASVDGEACPIGEIESRVDSIARDNLDIEIGQYYYPTDGDTEFMPDAKKTRAARRTISRALGISN